MQDRAALRAREKGGREERKLARSCLSFTQLAVRLAGESRGPGRQPPIFSHLGWPVGPSVSLWLPLLLLLPAILPGRPWPYIHASHIIPCFSYILINVSVLPIVSKSARQANSFFSSSGLILFLASWPSAGPQNARRNAFSSPWVRPEGFTIGNLAVTSAVFFLFFLSGVLKLEYLCPSPCCSYLSNQPVLAATSYTNRTFNIYL